MVSHVLAPDRVFDAATGTMLTDHAIVIDDGLVRAVAPVAEVADRITQPLPHVTLLPGLIDAHTHLAAPLDDGHGFASLVQRSGAQDALIGVKHAAETVRAGFTTVRDIGTWRAFTDVALRDAIDAGWVAGPRMQCAGAYLTAPGGAGDITGLAVDVDAVVPRELRFGVANGADQVRSTVRQILRYGADFIKVLATGAVLTSGTRPGAPEFTAAELSAAVETATDAGTYVAAHAHGTDGIKRAVRAGVRSIEHGSMLDDEAIELMVDTGTYLVADLYDGDYILEVGPERGYSDEVLRKTAETTDVQRSGFTKAVHAGVKVAFGSDAGVFPHGDNLRQLSRMVEWGMTPAEALAAATVHGAELLGLAGDVGEITPGAAADLVVLAANPLDDIRTVETPVAVLKAGVPVR